MKLRSSETTIRKTHLIEKKNPQHNQEWSWDETPELRAYIKKQELK